jgi:hypothetical protein
MVKSIAWVTPVATISIAVLAALALDRHASVVPQAHAQALQAGASEAMCPRGDATLRGTYMSKGGGSVVGVGPVAFIGTSPLRLPEFRANCSKSHRSGLRFRTGRRIWPSAPADAVELSL